nr:protoporphyrinogen oxidase [candidate division Zixibacteria bacterium]
MKAMDKKNIAIIGGGISGLSALHFLMNRYPDNIRVTLFEKESRLGGTIGTDRLENFNTDWGPNGFLDKVPLTLQMIHELGIEELLQPAHPKAEKRFIYRNKKLHEINPSPAKFMRSPVLSLGGRLRLAREPFINPKTDGNDESIFDFAERRIGREAAENLIGPMVSGIFGGDARKLSLRACFPAMVEMEREYGSLVKAMMAKKKNGGGGPAGPGGRLTSFKNGLYTLIEKMKEIYSDWIIIGKEVFSVDSLKDGFRLRFSDGSSDSFDAVICAVPAFAAAEILKKTDRLLAELLISIPYAPIAVAAFGYNREAVAHDLNGFGFLVPRSEGLNILGSIWTSSIFTDRTPSGMVQLRTMLGGATDPELVSLPDQAIIDIVETELRNILGITAIPEIVRLYKWDRGIPQFVLGHPEKMARMEDLLQNHPGLYFTGNAYDGVGLNDCVIRSDKVVNRLAGELRLTPSEIADSVR